jgi:hypothetical protein
MDIVSILNQINTNKFLNPAFYFNKAVVIFNDISVFFTKDTFTGTISFFQFVFTTLSIFFLCIIFYTLVRIFEIRRKEHEHLHHEIHEYAHKKKEREEKKRQNQAISKNPKWVKVLSNVFSEHSGDWKLAVIEADAILEDLMQDLGFKGESLGERLKNTNQENFRNLTSAWEVHTIRNRIAHEGMSFDLSQHEAKRIISIYEKIFRDYGFI